MIRVPLHILSVLVVYISGYNKAIGSFKRTEINPLLSTIKGENDKTNSKSGIYPYTQTTRGQLNRGLRG